MGVLTLIALPALYLANRPDPSDGTASDATATTEPIISAAPSVATTVLANQSSNRPPIEPPDDTPVFLDGALPDPDPGVAEIAVPRRPDLEPIALSASYRSSIADVTSCLVVDLAAGIAVTVKNLDNGRSVNCVTGTAPSNQEAGIVLHTDAFSLLADLTEAPIPVEVVQ